MAQLRLVDEQLSACRQSRAEAELQWQAELAASRQAQQQLHDQLQRQFALRREADAQQKEQRRRRDDRRRGRSQRQNQWRQAQLLDRPATSANPITSPPAIGHVLTASSPLPPFRASSDSQLAKSATSSSLISPLPSGSSSAFSFSSPDLRRHAMQLHSPLLVASSASAAPSLPTGSISSSVAFSASGSSSVTDSIAPLVRSYSSPLLHSPNHHRPASVSSTLRKRAKRVALSPHPANPATAPSNASAAGSSSHLSTAQQSARVMSFCDSDVESDDGWHCDFAMDDQDELDALTARVQVCFFSTFRDMIVFAGVLNVAVLVLDINGNHSSGT